MKVELTAGRLHHCGQLARTMRVDHHAALIRMGVPIHRELRDIFGRSYYRRAAFVDGHLAALWGVEGTRLTSWGRLWLVLSQYAMTFPITVARHAKREIAQIAMVKPTLVTTVIADDAPAQRLVVFLGFEAPDGFGGGPAKTRSARGNLARYLYRNGDLMVRAGNAQQVEVIFRRDWQ